MNAKQWNGLVSSGDEVLYRYTPSDAPKLMRTRSKAKEGQYLDLILLEGIPGYVALSCCEPVEEGFVND